MGMVSESECSADANRSGQARCPVLLEALAGIPANMTPVIKRYLGELDAGPASAVSEKPKTCDWRRVVSCEKFLEKKQAVARWRWESSQNAIARSV